MERVQLIKLKELEDAHHPNNRPEGETTEGFLTDEPIVGECFYINKDKWGSGYFRTSIVTEIINIDTFKTMNSIYKIIREND